MYKTNIIIYSKRKKYIKNFTIVFIYAFSIPLLFLFESVPQSNYSYKVFFAGFTSEGIADGSSWENQWEYTSVPWDFIGAGDTLFLDGGIDSIIYTSTLAPRSKGTYGAYTVVTKGRDRGHSGKVIFETGSSFGANLSKASFTEISGFIFRNITNSKIINIRGGSHHRIKACSLYVDGYSGIFSIGSILYIEILNNYFEQADNVKKQTDLIFVRGKTLYDMQDSLIVKNNTFICKNQSYPPHTDGLQTYLCKNTWVEGNKFYMVNNKTAYTQALYLSNSGYKIWILNNLVYAVAPATSPIVAIRNALPNLDSVFFVNNTFVGDINGSKLPAIDLKTSKEQYGYLTIKNNIFVNNFSGAAITAKEMISYDIDYNVYYTPNSPYVVKLDGSNKTLTSMQDMEYDLNSYDKKPLFKNFDWKFSKTKSVYLDYDFSLTARSTGVDDGTKVGIFNNDIRGTVRPQGKKWDIGAYETLLKKDK